MDGQQSLLFWAGRPLLAGQQLPVIKSGKQLLKGLQLVYLLLEAMGFIALSQLAPSGPHRVAQALKIEACMHAVWS